MRRNLFTTALFVFVVVFFILGTFFPHLLGLRPWIDFSGKEQLQKILNQRSYFEARLSIRYDKPPVYEERYTMIDDNGISTAQYRIEGYSGRMITITQPRSKTYGVSFFYGSLKEDDVWLLTNRPPRGNTNVHYTIFLHEIQGSKQGSRTVTFTDPHYWATTATQMYHIDLSKERPSGVLTLNSNPLGDPHFEQVVKDFREFGSPDFRKQVARAQACIRTGQRTCA